VGSDEYGSYERGVGEDIMTPKQPSASKLKLCYMALRYFNWRYKKPSHKYVDSPTNNRNLTKSVVSVTGLGSG
jgi:hypothetical protein